MRIFSIAATAAITLSIALAGSSSATAQSPANSPHHSHVLGYQDPQTGAFHSLPRTLAKTAPTSPATGKIDVSITIALESALTTGQAVSCEIYIEADFYLQNMDYQDSDGYNYNEYASGAATVAGKTATCIVTIPYSWTFPTPTTTNKLIQGLSGSYMVTVSGSASVADSGRTPGTATTAPAGLTVSRGLGGTLVMPVTVPADGAITHLTVSATL
jgi:hypothetical protein